MVNLPADGNKFDIIVWGATGFVGRRVVHQLATRYGATELRWALGGRNPAKLAAVRAQLGPGAANAPIITGDSHDTAALETLVKATKVVCTTVGPYAKYGSPLLAACARHGTHYCDITGEPHWMRKMIDAHQTEAQRSGARIVHACGFDSIPSDMGVFFLQREALQLHGAPCSHIKLRVQQMASGFSGGTPASLMYAMQQRTRDASMMRVMRDPYGLNPPDQQSGPDRLQTMMVGYDHELRAWTWPFLMSPVNTKVVRRTNALLGYPYGREFRYEEAMLAGRGPLGWAVAVSRWLRAAAFMLAATASPTRWLLTKCLLPRSGQGPSQNELADGSYDLILVGALAGGERMRARVQGQGHPATESTARMLVESAVCLAEDSARLTVPGGIWTPASAMGELLLKRLVSNAGLSFEILSAD